MGTSTFEGRPELDAGWAALGDLLPTASPSVWAYGLVVVLFLAFALVCSRRWEVVGG